MTHKYQNDVIGAVDFMKPSYGTEKHQEIQQELAEVYRKAEAWDRLSVSIRECNKENEVKSGLDAIVRASQKGQIVQRHIYYFESGDHS